MQLSPIGRRHITTYASKDIGDDREHHSADVRCVDHVVGGAVGHTIAAQSRNIF